MLRVIAFSERNGQMPLLVCLGDGDVNASDAIATQVASRAPNAQVKRYGAGHFGAYQEMKRVVFQHLISDQIAFLRVHLLSLVGPADSASLRIEVKHAPRRKWDPARCRAARGVSARALPSLKNVPLLAAALRRAAADRSGS